VDPGIRKWNFKIREQFWYKLLPYSFKLLPYLLVNPTVKISLFVSCEKIKLQIGLLLCIHTVPVSLKIWWWCSNDSPESGTWVTYQIRGNRRRFGSWKKRHPDHFYFCCVVGRPLSPTAKSSSFSFAVLSGGRFFQLPNRSWVAPSPSISPWLPLFEARDCLVFNAWGDQTWGISGPWRYWVAEDASVWGFRKSRDASQPVNL